MAEFPNLGRYEVTEEIGKGAMGIVYKAHDPVLSRTVAIKTINMTAADEEDRPGYEARLREEARMAGGLNHPNIVIIYDVGKSGDLVYMAMEYIEGQELRDMLDEGQPLSVDAALDIAAQVADGLAFAHENQVVHRDIKPANIMITPLGKVKIADFGIARMRTNQSATQTGVVLGSPKYMSPEQVIGSRADHRSDIFSLGVILYQMLTGSTPFNGDNIGALMFQITSHEPPAPSTANDKVPMMLDYIVAKILAKSADARYQSATELATDLRECSRRMTLGEQAMTQTTEILARQALTAATAPAEFPMPAETRKSDDQSQSQQALALQTGEGIAGHESTSTIPAMQANTSELSRRILARGSRRAWGAKETGIFSATVVVALAIASAVVVM